MRLGLAGYGQMGTITRELALSKGYKIEAIIDPHSKYPEVTHRHIDSSLPLVDVIIDFSDPTRVIGNIEEYAALGLSVVVGTTGWYDHLPYVADIVNKSGIGFIWAGNFSLGVNIYFHVLKKAAELFNKFEQYDIVVHEYHHNKKSDSPSGTAVMLGQIIIDRVGRKKRMISEAMMNRKIAQEELHVTSTRCGSIPGKHEVIFDSDIDTITVKHEARSRVGFAEGALTAASWIKDRKGIYCLDDMMESIVRGDDY